MKILHTIAQLPSRTGSGVYYSNVIEQLKKYGHEQAAIFACQDGYSFDIPEIREYSVSFKSERIPFAIAGMSDVMPYDSTVYSKMDDDMLRVWGGAFENALSRAKEEFNPDVVIMHHLWILTSMAVKIFDTTFNIGICHNTDIRQAEQHTEMKNKHAANIRELDAVFSLTESQQQKISHIFGIAPGKIKAIGGGFNEKLFYPSVSKKTGSQIQIVFSAKIEKSKGVFELVKAFKKVSKLKPSVSLDIIGTPNEENKRVLDSLIDNADNIEIVPIKSQRELADYIRSKDIFIMPSYFEGLGLMAIECLASGLRVVSTEIDGLMELLGEKVNKSGVIEYVKLPRIYDTDKPFDEDLDAFVENLADKMLKQIVRVEKGEAYPAGILSEISKYSWEGIVKRINSELIRK